jgi:hypothetical protein
VPFGFSFKYSYLWHSTSAAEDIFSVSSIENFNFPTPHSVHFRSRQHVYFKTLLETFPSHQHRANWQSTHMKSLIQNLPPKHCICIHDYSENYRCVEKNEKQSNYFQRTECSLHVTIINRHAILEYDGLDSADDFPEIITVHVFVISPGRFINPPAASCGPLAWLVSKKFLWKTLYPYSVVANERSPKQCLDLY